jgi:hypothetical protein
VLGIIALAGQAQAADIFVTNTTDTIGIGDGCSLREALTNASHDDQSGSVDCTAGSGADTIKFDLQNGVNGVVGSGPYTISPTSSYNLDDGTTIDGFSQAGASANTRSIALPSDAVYKIVIDGMNINSNCVVIVGANVTVRGLVTHDCMTSDFLVSNFGTGATIAGNYIGTDATGTVAQIDASFAMQIDVADAVIGGSAPADRNVISAHQSSGIVLTAGASGARIQGNFLGVSANGSDVLGAGGGSIAIRNVGAPGLQVGGTNTEERNVIGGHHFAMTIEHIGSAGATVQGNYVGVGADGTTAIPNGTGIYLADNISDVVVGGAAAGAGNVISNNGAGVQVDQPFPASHGPTIRGNKIGTTADGTAARGNGVGIVVTSGVNNLIIGGTGAGEGNIIANSTVGAGISIDSASTGITIRGNSIYGNLGLGIDLGNDGVTGNDGGLDGDTGANNLQNFPDITSAQTDSIGVVAQGTLDSAAGTTYNIDLYSSPACDGSGKLYLGSGTATTNGSGHAIVQVGSVLMPSPGNFITMTATDPSGNTSELSACRVLSAPEVVVTPSSGLVTTEAGGTATFTVNLTTIPSNTVTFTLSSSTPTEGTVSPTTVTFQPDATAYIAQTITVTGADDLIADGNVPYTIITGNVTSGDLHFSGLVVPDVSVTNTDNDVPGIVVNPASGLVTTEAGGTATFDIRLNSVPTGAVTVALSSSDTTEGTVSPASLTFQPNVSALSPQTVTITGVDDSVQDGNVPYTIITGDASSPDPTYNAALVTDVGVTNTDNDVAGIVVSQTSGLVTTESGGTATFTVRLATVPTAPVTLPLASSDATEGTVSPPGLTFPADATALNPQTVTVTGVDDLVADGSLGYSIVTAPSVSSDPLYNNVNPPDVSVTNTDDETVGITVSPTGGLTTTEAGGTATFTVALNTVPTAAVTIALSSSNTAEGTVSPSTLTFPASVAAKTPQTVTVTGVDDSSVDGNVAYTIVTAPASSADAGYNGLNASDVSVTNTDNDVAGFTVTPTGGLTTTESGGTATFTVRANAIPSAAVTVALSSSDTTEGTVSPAALTFQPNTSALTPQTVTVTGVDDSTADGNVAYTIVTAPAVSTDTHYNGVNPADVSMTNTDNESGAGLSIDDVSVAEGNSGTTSATFTVTLSPPSAQTVTVVAQSADGTATAASGDYTALPATTVTFGPGTTTQTVTVQVKGDTLNEPDETFFVTLSNPTNAAIGRARGTGTIRNDDAPPGTTPPDATPPDATPKDNKDDIKPKLTEEQRQQKQHTNKGNRDDVYTEGNVVEVHQDEQPPYVVIGNKDGLVRVNLLCGDQCPTIKVGDYLEADGEKQSEVLFDATDVDVK